MSDLRHALRSPRFLAVIVAGVLSSPAAGQSTLTGRVVDSTGAPVRGAVVTVNPVRYSVRSDSLGAFTLAGTPGSELNLAISADGFREEQATVMLARRGTVTREFTLVSLDAPLPEANPSDRMLRGRIVDPEGAPVGYVNIQMNGGRRIVADDSGRFNLPVTVNGTISLLFRRIGFGVAEASFDAMPDTVLRVEMTPLAVSLPGQRITASSPFTWLEQGGFYRRMREVERGAARGYFITPEDLDFRKPLNTTDAVEQFPEIQLQPSNAELTRGDQKPVFAPRNMRIEDRNRCPLTVFLNGVRIQPILGSNGQLRDEQINSIIQPLSIAGIEVYPRLLGAPPQYQPVMGSCGVVLIWTK